MTSRKEWMLGIPGHNEVVRIEDVLLLVKGGQLRPTDLVKKLGEPWRAANEIAELVPHFTEAAAAADRARPPVSVQAPREEPEPRPEKPAIAAPVRTAEAPAPRRNITDRVARVSRPPESTRSVPRAETSRASSSTEKTETAAPSVPRSEPLPPRPAAPKEEKKEESKPPPSKLRDRMLPKPPPAPVRLLEPMVAKYYSPVDLLRSASLAFDPKKLLLCLPVVLLTLLGSIGMFRGASGGGAIAGALSVFSAAILVFGTAVLLTGLAFVTRRQLEGKEYRVGEVIRYTGGNWVTALIYPVIALFPSIVSLGILWVLGWARNRSPGMATALKLGYLLPMIFAFVAVLGALVYQVASMYVPSSAAVEGHPPGVALRETWVLIRRQWGRVVLHWLIVTVAVGVISAVCLGLAQLAVSLPEIVFGAPEDETIATAWSHFAALAYVYRGLAFGLGLMLPLSLLSTLGTLSYMALRHPESAQVSSYAMEDTSGSGIPVMRGGPTPMESTNPAETRPAPSEAARAGGPGVTPVPEEEEISEDSDEQPLVKE